MKIRQIFHLAAAAIVLAGCSSTPVGFTEMDNIRPMLEGGQMMGSGGLTGEGTNTSSGGGTTPADTTCQLCGGWMMGSGG